MGNKKDQVTGQVKEKAGEALGSKDLETKGRREKVKGNVKASGQKLKDAAKSA